MRFFLIFLYGMSLPVPAPIPPVHSPPPGLRLRLATPADLPALREFIPLSVRALSIGSYSPAQIESAIRHVFGPDAQLIADGTYFIVESFLPGAVTPALVGCGGWSRHRTLYGGDQLKSAVSPPTSADASDALLDPATDPARIRAFFVHPDHARQGIATLLLRACRHAARSAGFTHLELAATLPGVPFYARHGFTSDGPLETTLPDGTSIAFVRMSSKLEFPTTVRLH